MGFTLYMRYVLTPMSAMTWANLNHSLCSVDNDPWKAYFRMHKFYYFFAEFYLGLTSVVTQYFICIIGFIFCSWRQFTIHADGGIKLRQVFTGIALILGLIAFATHCITTIKADEESNYKPHI